MTIEHAKIWNCSYCETRFTQEGPRAMAMPSVPPDGWLLIDARFLRAAHAVKTETGPVKVGDALENIRRVCCPTCKPNILRVLA